MRRRFAFFFGSGSTRDPVVAAGITVGRSLIGSSPLGLVCVSRRRTELASVAIPVRIPAALIEVTVPLVRPGVVGVIVVVVVPGGTIVLYIEVDVPLHTSTAMAALIAISVARTHTIPTWPGGPTPASIRAAFSVLHLMQNPLGIGSLASGR